MTTSRFGAVIDSLVAMFGATDVVATFDGPPLTSEVPPDYVIVGGTDDPDDDAGTFDQVPSSMGNLWVDESGEITCAVLAGTGDDDVKVARDRALAILAEFAVLIRTNRTLNDAIPAGYIAYLASGRPSQRRNTNGTYVRIVFTVAYTALLTT